MKNLTNSVLIIAALFASVLLTFSYAEGQPLPQAAPPTENTSPTTATEPVNDSPVAASEKPAVDEAPVARENLVERMAEEVPEGKKLVARVVWIKGTLNAVMPGGKDKRTLKMAANIYMNDTLVTEKDSEAQIIFTDNSTMTFRPDTKLYINEYNYVPKSERKTKEAKKSAGKYVLDLVTGGFRTITGLVARENPNDYKVNTPVATIGVRGTEYSLVYKQGQDLYIKRYTGEPCMTNSAKASQVGPNKKKHSGGGGAAASGASNEVCLNEMQQYGYVASADVSPVAMVAQPAVFRTDVEVIPVNFSTRPTPAAGQPNTKQNSSSFCIQ